jgi:cytochrome c556
MIPFPPFLKVVAVAALLGTTANSAMAAETAADSRSEIMLTAKAAMKAAVPMIKGQTPWDPAKALLAARALNAVSYAIVKYVPEGSITADSEASPKIWQDMKGFQAAAMNLREKSAGAIEAVKMDAEEFAAALMEVGKTCKGCHQTYREKK